jgi:hypothetical protein
MSYRRTFNDHCLSLEQQNVSSDFLTTIKEQYAFERKLPYKAAVATLGALFISCAHLFIHI